MDPQIAKCALTVSFRNTMPGIFNFIAKTWKQSEMKSRAKTRVIEYYSPTSRKNDMP